MHSKSIFPKPGCGRCGITYDQLAPFANSIINIRSKDARLRDRQTQQRINELQHLISGHVCKSLDARGKPDEDAIDELEEGGNTKSEAPQQAFASGDELNSIVESAVRHEDGSKGEAKEVAKNQGRMHLRSDYEPEECNALIDIHLGWKQAGNKSAVPDDFETGEQFMQLLPHNTRVHKFKAKTSGLGRTLKSHMLKNHGALLKESQNKQWT